MLRDDILEALEEMVFDENEVVTYRCVCQRWKVHANIAKEVLNDFYIKQTLFNKRSLFAWYAVFHSFTVKLVPETKLERHINQGSSSHLYAILQSRSEDPYVIYLADMNASFKDCAMSAVTATRRLSSSCVHNPQCAHTRFSRRHKHA